MGVSATKLEELQSSLKLHDPAGQLARRYEYWLAKTGDPSAAATLVLAEVQASAVMAEFVHPSDSTQLDGAEFLTVKQAAQKYNLGERTIYRMVEEGLPVTRAGRAIRIRPRDLAKRLADSETILH